MHRSISVWIPILFKHTHTDTQGSSEHVSLWAVDYLGSRGAGLLIATQKLMSEEKMEEREETAE